MTKKFEKTGQDPKMQSCCKKENRKPLTNGPDFRSPTRPSSSGGGIYIKGNESTYSKASSRLWLIPYGRAHLKNEPKMTEILYYGQSIHHYHNVKLNYYSKLLLIQTNILNGNCSFIVELNMVKCTDFIKFIQGHAFE